MGACKTFRTPPLSNRHNRHPISQPAPVPSRCALNQNLRTSVAGVLYAFVVPYRP